ncbi:hypothetical protein [Nocardioides sp. R-C-SC26]|uniref:hypothetical protein n=1 Tax=Nocardioides sp. R-C-SC26 TaxID=2870414 RepID=UPI001E35593C|nr:hypothetical protein [Nocardioides sp. R-C-SC26]
MTTAKARRGPSTPMGGSRALVWSALAGALGGTAVSGAFLVLAVVGAIDGSWASTGFVGAVLAIVAATVGVMTFGAMMMSAVATVWPAASLLLALLTYATQIMLLGLIFVALDRSGVAEDGDARAALGAPVIAVSLCWTFTHVLMSMKARIPVYDLPSAGVSAPVPADPRRATEQPAAHGTEGSER